MAVTKHSEVVVPLCYGESRVDGIKIFEDKVEISNKEQYLCMVYVIAEGPIASFKNVKINDEDLFVGSYQSGVIGQADISAKFNKHIQIELWNGHTDGRHISLFDTTSTKWKADSTLNGKAAIALKIRLGGEIKDENVTLTSFVKGRLVQDIRYQSNEEVYGYTSGGGVYDSVTEPGTNPALCLYDYLTHTRYGAGFTAVDLNLNSFIEAANWCDVNLIRCNGVIDQAEEYKKIIEALLLCFRASLTRLNGVVHLMLDVPAVSVQHYELEHTINKIKIEYQAQDKYFNQLEVTYNTLYEESDTASVLYPPTNDDPFILKDNKVIKEDLSLPFTNSKAEVDLLASMIVRSNLEQTEIEFETVEDGYNVSVNDVFTITLDEAGWVNKAFRVVEHTSDIFGDNPLTVKIKAREYTSEIYDLVYDGVVIPTLAKINVPDPSNLQFNFEDSKFGITGKLTWDQSLTTYETHVMYKLSAEPDTAFQRYTIVKTNEALITDLKNTYYDFYVVNRDIFNRSSEICYLRNVNCFDATVLPKVTNLQAQSDSPDFIFTWDSMLDVDIKITDPKNPSTIGSGKVKDVFLGYEVEVYVRNVLALTRIVTDNKFIFDYDTNTKNGISRNVTFKVSVVAKYGARSPVNTINAVNYQQQVLSGIEVFGGLSGITVKFDAPTANDHRGVLVHMSKTRDFTPLSNNILVDLVATNSIHQPVIDDGVYFFKLGAYDCFGKDSIVYSPEFEASVQDVNAMLQDISSDQLSIDLLNTITGKADTSTVNLNLQEAKTELQTLANNAKTQADKGVADALAASNKATTEANRVLGLANTKTNTDITAAKAVAVADLNAAKVILNQAIADSIVDLAPVNAKILAVEKTSVDADTATALRIDGLVTKTDTQAASITSLSNTVTTNKNAIATRVDTVEATALTQAQAAETNAKAFATASVTTEKDARVAADSALTTLVNTVKATADKNKADIVTVSTAYATADTALSNRIDTVTASVDTVNGKVTTEQTARASADTALSSRIDTVTATANKNKADIVTVNTALADQNTAFASSLTTMETTVKADSTTKAEAAKAAALVTAAADAKTKADKALADAKVDASSKASTAESNAKVAAATDAAAKAAQAVVDAKAYADTKKAEAATYTNSKYDAAVTLINQKDAAQASALTSMETTVKADSTTKANQALNDALAQSGGTNLLNISTFNGNGNKGGWNTGSVVEISSVTGVSALDGRTHALKLTTRDSYEYSNTIPVSAGETIYWGAWINTQATSNRVNFGYRKYVNGAPQNSWITATFLNGSTGWTWIQGSQVMHSDATSIVPFLQISATSNYGSPLVQDIVISRSPVRAGALAAKDSLNAGDVGADPAGSAAAAQQAAQTYSNGKYNEAVTLINQKDSAQSTKTSNLEAAVGYSISEINNQETNLDFKRGILNWDNGSVVNDTEVGRCLELTSSLWPTNSVYIPVDTSKTYRLSAKIKQHTVSGNKNSYLGVRTYDANFQELTGGAGTYRYCGKNGGDTPTTWTTYSGNITGVGDLYNQFRAGTCYIKVMAIGNYSGGSGKCRFADFKFEDITEQLQVNARITDVDNALATKDAAMTSRVTTMETTVKADATTKANQALVDAKSYADTKKTEAATYTNSKYDAAVTLINQKDSAQASALTTMETTVRSDSTTKANQAELNAIAAAANITLLTSGSNLTSKGNSVVKTAGGSNWTMQAYSKQSFKSGAAVSGIITDGVANTISFMIGLNSDPEANASYTSLDYALYPTNTTWGCYESGASRGTVLSAAPAVGDTFSIEYDGINVRYYINGNLVRTVAAPADLTFYLDSSYTSTKVSLGNLQLQSFNNLKDAEAIAIAKANDAETNAKSAAATYTNTKYNDAVNLINSKDSSMASRVTTMETSVTTMQAPAGLAHRQDITITGDANTYYPVYIKYGDQNYTRRLIIQRSFNETAPNSWASSSTHKGGLLLDILGNWGGWGGQNLDWRIQELKQSYSTMYGGAGITGNNMMFVVWLRGGSAIYHLSSDQSLDIQIGYTVNDIIRPDTNPSYVIKALAAKTAPATTAEINAKLVTDKAYIGLDQVDNKSSATIVSEAATYTNTKYNEAVNLINSKDSAQASLITSLEANVSRVNTNSEQNIISDCIFNSRFTLKNSENRPTGWYAAFSNADTSTIGFHTDGTGMLTSATDAEIGIASTAFRLQAGVEYTIRIKVSARVAKSAGFYFRMMEYDAELPRGKMAISTSSPNEAAVQAATREINLYRENAAIGTSWETYEWKYKPTSTAKYAGAVMLNWTGMGVGNALYIDYVSVTADVSNDYTNTKFNEAVNLVNTKDSAQATRVTSLEARVKSAGGSVNLLLDAGFEQPFNNGMPIGFDISGGNLPKPTLTSWAAPGDWSLDYQGLTGVITQGVPSGTNPDLYYDILSRPVTVTKGQRVGFSVYTGSHRCRTAAFIYFYNSAGAIVGNSPLDYNFNQMSGGKLLTGYKRLVSYADVPTNAVSARACLRKSNTDQGQTSSYYFYVMPHLSYWNSDQTEAPDWCSSTTQDTYTSAKFNESVSLINTVDGKLNATWALRLDAGNKISGIGLANNGTSSTFSVLADSFKIYANGADNAVFAVENGKLIVKTAHIGELDSANIKAGSIDAGHLSASAITAAQANFNGANITNGTISFLKISDDIKSTNFVLNSAGWQLTKGGSLNATNVNVSGYIFGSHIKGGLVEGAVMFGSEGYLQATVSDTGSGTRKGCYPRLQYEVQAEGTTSWTNYAEVPMCSADYTGDGSKNISGGGNTLVLANNYYRSRTNNLEVTGKIDLDTSTIVVLSNSTQGVTFNIQLEISSLSSTGVRTVISTAILANQVITKQASGVTQTFALGAGWGGTLTLTWGQMVWNDEGATRRSISSAVINITSMPTSITYTGNKKAINFRLYAGATNTYTSSPVVASNMVLVVKGQ